MNEDYPATRIPAGDFDPARVRVVAFDGDDTLWHCERYFRRAEDEYAALLAAYGREPAVLIRDFHRRMIAGLPVWGYGVKSTILAMLETALELTGGQLSGRETAAVLAIGKELRQVPTELLPGAATAPREIGRRYRVWLVTKGDPLDQQRKLEESGLRDCFEHVEVVPEKTPEAYAGLLRHFGVAPEEFLMVGNSPRSDILPVYAIGGQAVFVPSRYTWYYEEHPEFIPGVSVGSLEELPGIFPDLRKI